MKKMSRLFIMFVLPTLLMAFIFACGNDGDDSSPENQPAPPQDISGTYDLEASYASSTCIQEFAQLLQQTSPLKITASITQDTQDRSKATITTLQCSSDCSTDGIVEGNTVSFEDIETETIPNSSCNIIYFKEKTVMTINDPQVSGNLSVEVTFQGNNCAPNCTVQYNITGSRVS